MECFRFLFFVWSVTLSFHVHFTLSNATCGGMIELRATTTYSVLSDGSDQQEYEHNLDCSWLLRAPTGSTLRLEFIFFSLESIDSKTGKCYDYVEIVDGTNSSQSSLGRYCGGLTGRISQPFVSTKSRMLIKFHTDKAVSAQGFEVRYRTESVLIEEPKIYANNAKDLHLVADGKIVLTGEVIVASEVVVGSSNVPLLTTLRQLNESMTNYQNQQTHLQSLTVDDAFKRIEQLENSIKALGVDLEHPSNKSIFHPNCPVNCSGNGVCTLQYNSTAAEWLPACSCYPGYIRPTCSSRMHTKEGDGSDGIKIISKNETFTTCVALSTSTVTGSTVLAISSMVSWLKAGDEILIIQMQGETAGQYEFNRVQKIFRTLIYLTYPLGHNYSTTSKTRAQLVKVPHYSHLTIKQNGKLTALNWNGTSGGIVIFRAKTLTIDEGGSIDVDGKGFRGGPTKRGAYWCGVTGESWKEIGFLKNNYKRNAGGGGSAYCTCREVAGGGSYGTVGLSPIGTPCRLRHYTSPHGQPGDVYGSSNLTKLFLGSGGGGGCSYLGLSDTCAAYSGSNGGGIIYIEAATATIHGALTSAGSHIAKQSGGCARTVGGPGSGGTILLRTTTLTLDVATAPFNISGGGRVFVYSGIYSGTGGNGRLRVDFDTLNGYPHGTASLKTIQFSFPQVGFWGSVP